MFTWNNYTNTQTHTLTCIVCRTALCHLHVQNCARGETDSPDTRVREDPSGHRSGHARARVPGLVPAPRAASSPPAAAPAPPAAGAPAAPSPSSGPRPPASRRGSTPRRPCTAPERGDAGQRAPPRPRPLPALTRGHLSEPQGSRERGLSPRWGGKLRWSPPVC